MSPALSVLVGAVLLSPPAADPPGPASRPAAGNAAARAVAVARAIEDLQSPDWIVKHRAIRQFVRWQTPAAKAPLKAILAGKAHPWVRGRALVALAEIFAAEALDDALAFASAKEPELRAAAVEALGILRAPRGDPAAAAALKDPSPEVRCQAILATARLRKAKAWPVVQPLLTEKDPKLLRYVARALQAVATPAAQDELAKLLSHDDDAVRLEAIRALGAFRRGGDIAALLRRMSADDSAVNREAAAAALSAYPPGLLHEHMLQALRGEDDSPYRSAIRLLGVRPTRASCDAVAAMLRASEKKYRSETAAILALLADREPDRYLPVFLEHLADRSSTVRRQAIRSIGRCRTPDHFAVLAPALSDVSGGARADALSALRKAAKGSPAGGLSAYLARSLRDESSEVRKRAIHLLAERASPGELDAALRSGALDDTLGSSSTSWRAYAVELLGQKLNEQMRWRLAAAQGYVTDWMVIGPLPNDKANTGLAAVYAPEVAVDFKKDCPEVRFGAGAVFETTERANGRATGLRIGPPSKPPGRTVVRYVIDLPAAKAARLLAAVSVEHRPDAAGAVKLAVLAEGKALLERSLTEESEPEQIELALPAWPGGRRRLDLVVETADKARGACVVLGRPRIVVEGAKPIALAPLARTAVARTEASDKKAGRLRWQAYRVAGGSGSVPFHDIFPAPTNYHVGYAAAELASAADRTVVLEIESDDGHAVWLNGRVVHRAPEKGAGKIKVTLRKGRNLLLVKVANLVDWWQVKVRLADEKGRRVDITSPAASPAAGR